MATRKSKSKSRVIVKNYKGAMSCEELLYRLVKQYIESKFK